MTIKQTLNVAQELKLDLEETEDHPKPRRKPRLLPTTAPKPFVFVLMPFLSQFDDIYKFGIKGASEDAGAYCERVDEQMFVEGILDRIFNQISKADVIIADMTGRNANVFYEVGYAHALGKIAILLTQDANDIPFDLKHRQHIVYERSIGKLRPVLTERLIWAIDEARRRRDTAQDKYPCTLTVENYQILESKPGENPMPVQLRAPLDQDIRRNWRSPQIEIPFRITVENESPAIPLKFEAMYFEIPKDRDLVLRSHDTEIIRVGNDTGISEERPRALFTRADDPQVIAPGAVIELNGFFTTSHLKIQCPLSLRLVLSKCCLEYDIEIITEPVYESRTLQEWHVDLRSDSTERREAAINATTQFCEQGAFILARTYLTEVDERLKDLAKTALEWLREHNRLPAELAIENYDQHCREAWILAISPNSEIKNPQVEDILSAGLVSSDKYVRLCSIRALGWMPGLRKASIQVLKKSAQDRDITIRSTTIQVLGRILPPARELSLFVSALTDHALAVRLAAANVLAAVPELPATVAPIMLGALFDGDIRIQRFSFTAIPHLEAARQPAVPLLIEILNKHPNSEVRSLAAKTLGQLGSAAAAAVKDLARTIANVGSGELRRMAILALAEIGEPPEVVSSLMPVLKQDVQIVAPILGRLATAASACIPALVECIDESSTSSAIDAVAGAMKSIDGPSAVPGLIKQFTDSNEALSSRANRALAIIGECAVPSLLLLLPVQNEAVQTRTINLLQKLGGEAHRAVPALKRFAEQSRWDLQTRTREAIAVIESQCGPEA